MNRAKCDVPYCANERLGAGRYCQPHAKAFRRYGHPQSRALLPREYAEARKQIAATLKEYARHEAVQIACAWLDTWLRAAAAGEDVPAAHQIARVHAKGIDGRRVLEELAAVWRYTQCRPRPLPDDVRLTFQLANAALRLAPRELKKTYIYNGQVTRRYVSISRADREAAGKFIRGKLAVLLHHIATAPEQAAIAAEAERQALLTPLVPMRAVHSHPVTQQAL